MTDPDPRPNDFSPDALLRAMTGGTQPLQLAGALGEMVLAMTRENAASFAEAMTGIVAARTPLDAARLYSDYLASSTHRLARQFMEVTQAASQQPHGEGGR